MTLKLLVAFTAIIARAGSPLFKGGLGGIFLPVITLIFLTTLTGCGFHLRGSFEIPACYQVLKICPNQPLEPFQRHLRKALIANCVQIVDPNCPPACPTADLQTANTTNIATLNLLSQDFSETIVAYGTDGQPNRSILRLKIAYQLKTPNCPETPINFIQVERELALKPNAVLGTDNEREYLISELYLDAVTQFIRQLSSLCKAITCGS